MNSTHAVIDAKRRAQKECNDSIVCGNDAKLTKDLENLKELIEDELIEDPDLLVSHGERMLDLVRDHTRRPNTVRLLAEFLSGLGIRAPSFEMMDRAMKCGSDAFKAFVEVFSEVNLGEYLVHLLVGCSLSPKLKPLHPDAKECILRIIFETKDLRSSSENLHTIAMYLILRHAEFDVSALRALLMHGCINPDERRDIPFAQDFDCGRVTPLQHAILRGCNTSWITALLGAGANVNAQNPRGLTAIDLVGKYGPGYNDEVLSGRRYHKECDVEVLRLVDTLISHGANLSHVSSGAGGGLLKRMMDGGFFLPTKVLERYLVRTLEHVVRLEGADSDPCKSACIATLTGMVKNFDTLHGIKPGVIDNHRSKGGFEARIVQIRIQKRTLLSMAETLLKAFSFSYEEGGYEIYKLAYTAAAKRHIELLELACKKGAPMVLLKERSIGLGMVARDFILLAITETWSFFKSPSQCDEAAFQVARSLSLHGGFFPPKEALYINDYPMTWAIERVLPRTLECLVKVRGAEQYKRECLNAVCNLIRDSTFKKALRIARIVLDAFQYEKEELYRLSLICVKYSNLGVFNIALEKGAPVQIEGSSILQEIVSLHPGFERQDIKDSMLEMARRSIELDPSLKNAMSRSCVPIVCSAILEELPCTLTLLIEHGCNLYIWMEADKTDEGEVNKTEEGMDESEEWTDETEKKLDKKKEGIDISKLWIDETEEEGIDRTKDETDKTGVVIDLLQFASLVYRHSVRNKEMALAVINILLGVFGPRGLDFRSGGLRVRDNLQACGLLDGVIVEREADEQVSMCGKRDREGRMRV